METKPLPRITAPRSFCPAVPVRVVWVEARDAANPNTRHSGHVGRTWPVGHEVLVARAINQLDHEVIVDPATEVRPLKDRGGRPIPGWFSVNFPESLFMEAQEVGGGEFYAEFSPSDVVLVTIEFPLRAVGYAS